MASYEDNLIQHAFMGRAPTGNISNTCHMCVW